MAKSGKRKASGALADSPSHLLHRALQAALGVFAEETGSGALTQRQFALLAAAAELEAPSQTDLVTATGTRTPPRAVPSSLVITRPDT